MKSKDTTIRTKRSGVGQSGHLGNSNKIRSSVKVANSDEKWGQTIVRENTKPEDIRLTKEKKCPKR